ncbi:Putative phosphinothricin acetyltransferase YwnH [Pseudoalteromonas holothuriae]|uniref:Phosphinothricin acetyltransferase YwnH n=1 Tax=Pseudoalteromonas holothuriae TaxID=2963714 RepID=A0A9W4QR60_9GAMM|nr:MULTISPECIES: GNAT family N-acetyltransferase [unclassified Pseudoalteromonas]CAH9049641.1 Putative phosphinothricin acetyltransferase YwnH [Pseudoalteromonas sp. CIP111854]CAH9051445.1 Putative phosphinothricin acetyltransferase YwnH [Pseudoalteromonas sp. CIP111951]
MTIRIAKIEDLQSITDIYNETIASRMVTADTEMVSAKQRLEWFNSHYDNRPLFVYEQAGAVLAWLSFKSFYGRPAYSQTCEISIYIATQARGKGLGNVLMDFAQSHAKLIDVSALLGFIFSHNTPSLSLFKRHGFKSWGELPDIAKMDNSRYSLTIMGKHLDE